MATQATRDWWRGAVIYQIYPRSFFDSNNDGIGDIPGITAKLDYIASLGVDAVWLSPFFKSPMKDFGYDVEDYRLVDPIFGCNADFKAMLDKAHSLGLKVMIDMVISHSSDQHAWFQESRQSRNNPKHDWYVWADPKPDGSPPNNWQSVFGGCAWQWEPRRKQYYLHNFLASQPDLNIHHPEVQVQLLDELKFWLELGVDGFRLDTVNYYLHDTELRDNPPNPDSEQNPGINPYTYQLHWYDKNRPENISWLKTMRQFINGYPGSFLMGEIGDITSAQLMGEYLKGNDRLHTAYSFRLLKQEQSAEFIAGAINELEQALNGSWPSWALCNHDTVRVVSRWGEAQAGQKQKAKLYLALLHCLRGSVCLYQGEELGLTEAELTFEQLQDPQGINFWPEDKGRDGCRTPIPWQNGATHGGFSQHTPWLPMPAEHLSLAVDNQEAATDSVLQFSRELLRWRKQYPQLLWGEISEVRAEGEVLCFTRSLDGYPPLHCAFNLGAQAAGELAGYHYQVSVAE